MFTLQGITPISTGTSISHEMLNDLIDWAVYAQDVQDVLAHNDPKSPDTNIFLRVRKCRLEDGSGALAVADNFASTLDFGVNGVNGLDAGSLAGSQHYYVYLIGKDNDADSSLEALALLGSTVTTPALPSGWNFFRRVGSACADASGNLLRFRQRNNHIVYTQNPLVQTAAVSGAVSKTSLDLSGFVSPDAHTATLRLRANGGPLVSLYVPGASGKALYANGPSGHQGEGSGEISVVGAAVDYDVAGSTGNYWINCGGYFFPLDAQP